MRRYRPSRSWPVGALALLAAGGAVLATGALSSALEGGSAPAFAARIGQGMARSGPVREARAAVAAPVTARAPAAPPPRAAGEWQIQVGAFRSATAAEAHLRALERGLPELAGLNLVHQLRGGLNRVRVGGIEGESKARRLCARIRATGRGCFVVAPEG